MKGIITESISHHSHLHVVLLFDFVSIQTDSTEEKTSTKTCVQCHGGERFTTEAKRVEFIYQGR